MKQFFRDYFTFNKRERNGVFVLITIIILLIVYLNVSDNFYKNEPVNFSKFEQEIAAFETQQTPVFKAPEKAVIADSSSQTEINYFDFNPNNLPEEDWLKLGLTQKQIKTIKNYEAKGGSFRKKEDLKKIYGITSELYANLEKHIVFSKKEETVVRNTIIEDKQLTADNKKPIKNETKQLELNTADSAQLTTIKGIGAFFAKSIIKYRNQLGGFYSKNQLLEIWKFDQEKLKAIEDKIIINKLLLTEINVNTCTDKELKHPYLTWNMVNAIINYRKNHGNYKTIDEIKKTGLVDEETFGKIKPYLIIE